MIEWINFILLGINIILFGFLYILSVQPMKRKEKKGEKAWRQCTILRSLSGVFEFIIIINSILWIWFPIPVLNWKINPNHWISIGFSLVIIIPGLTIMLKGLFDAGSESLKPSQDTELYRGIYQYIRHPQTLGEFPLFVALGFLVNSWFLVIIMTIFIVIYIPIMIFYEERDLIKRFGDKYREYKKRTGALIPRFS